MVHSSKVSDQPVYPRSLIKVCYSHTPFLGPKGIDGHKMEAVSQTGLSLSVCKYAKINVRMTRLSSVKLKKI